MEERKVKGNNIIITYYLTRKNIKRLNMHFRPGDGTIQVSAPRGINVKVIDDFVASNETYVLKAMEKHQQDMALRSHFTKYNTLLLGKDMPLVYKKGDDCHIKVEKEQIHIYTNGITPPDRVYDLWLNNFRQDIYVTTLNKYAPLVPGCPVFRLVIKDSLSRWGYCMPRERVIMLNSKLICTPSELIEYVALHELTHFLHPNHSSLFWRQMGLIMPDCKERRKGLRDYEFILRT